MVSYLSESKLDLFPLWRTLRNYSWAKARADGRAGLNVALLDFPQGMAYALIAGLPVQFGIYCSALASISGPLLASSRFIMLGPTNSTAVLLLSSFLALHLPPEQVIVALPILLLMVGGFMILGAYLRVSEVLNYISRSVITGYITAAAALIIVNQAKNVLGIELPRVSNVLEILWLTFAHLGETQIPSLALGLFTASLYFATRRLWPDAPHVAMTLVVVALGSIFMEWNGWPVPMLSAIPAGTWPITVPALDPGLVGRLANTAMAIAFLSALESSSIAKTLAARAGDRVDVNQQLLSMGAANVANAFGSGMPVSGSLTRSMLNFTSGAKTPMASIFSGIILVAAILVCGPLIGFIPKPALAVLVILVGFSLVQPAQIRTITRATKSDATVFYITFMAGLLFPLDTAIYMGAGASIILFLRKVSRPHLVEYAFNERGDLAEKDEREKSSTPEISIVHVEGDLFFGSTEIFLGQTRSIVANPNLKVIILRLKNAHHLDATSALAIGELVAFARSRGRDIIVSGAHSGIERVFVNSGLLDQIGTENFFRHSKGNPTVSTRLALLRAQEIIGSRDANIVVVAEHGHIDAGSTKTEDDDNGEENGPEAQETPNK